VALIDQVILDQLLKAADRLPPKKNAEQSSGKYQGGTGAGNDQ